MPQKLTRQLARCTAVCKLNIMNNIQIMLMRRYLMKDGPGLGSISGYPVSSQCQFKWVTIKVEKRNGIIGYEGTVRKFLHLNGLLKMEKKKWKIASLVIYANRWAIITKCYMQDRARKLLKNVLTHCPCQLIYTASLKNMFLLYVFALKGSNDSYLPIFAKSLMRSSHLCD